MAIAGDLNSTPKVISTNFCFLLLVYYFVVYCSETYFQFAGQSAIYDFIATADVSFVDGPGLLLLHFAFSFFLYFFAGKVGLNSIYSFFILDSWIHNSTTAGKFLVSLNLIQRGGHLETIMQLGNWIFAEMFGFSISNGSVCLFCLSDELIDSLYLLFGPCYVNLV